MSRSRKGLVIEFDRGAAVVLTPTGEFVKVKLTKGKGWPELGDEITFPEAGGLWQFSRRTKLAAVAALIVFLVITPFVYQFALTLHPTELPVASYLTVDINPSIELGLGINRQVVSAKALNSDGQKVLNELKLLGLPGENAVERIIEQAVTLGYLEPDTNIQNILITYVPLTENHQNEKQLYAEKARKVLQAKSIAAQVEVISASDQVRSKAHAVGLSTGKYLVFLEAVNDGLEITEEQMKKESLTESINLAGGDLKQLIQKAAHEKDIAKLEEEVKAKLQRKELKRNQDEGKEPKREPERAGSHEKIEVGNKTENQIENTSQGKGLKIEIGAYKNDKREDVNGKRNPDSTPQQRSKELKKDVKEKQESPGNNPPQFGPGFVQKEEDVTELPEQLKKRTQAGKKNEDFSNEARQKEAEKLQVKVKGEDGNK
ncbi:anti-sigma-I factor RsgI family protein [Zhaonella formicivorans]|uniref:anti-sigma-I factor RsgI family protein n=1 Tax=Zhaonella formicivorans TaxID=2528593 RepID=UPI0010D6AB93|nr:anti-sigma factor domain-containing protein [Zhaonella formicivorans]